VALSRDSLDERFMLGRGHFGRVVLATHRESGLVLAVKEMREERAGAGKARRGARSGQDNVQLLKQVGERLLLATLGDNAWVSRLALAFRERGRLYLGFELSARGDLWTLLRAKKRLALPSARFLVAEVSAALASVHALGIVHRDIKLENITLDHGGHVKLIDFGLAKQLARRAPKSADEPPRFGFTFTHVGTSYYFAPEMVSGAGHSLATDWWQVGCLLYELVVRRPAFFDRDPKAVEAKIASRQGPDMAAFGAALDSSSSSSTTTTTTAEEREAATATVRALLTHEAGDRLGTSSAQQVLTHAFFRGLDMAAVQQRTETPPSEIHAYVTLPGAQDQRAVTRDVVATYFRDAKTLENEPLNKSPASTQGSTSTMLEERTAAMKPTSDGSERGSARTQGSSKSSVTACSECMGQAEAASHMAPREPARQEEIGPFAGFAYINDKLVHALAKDLFAA
jgi:serine/threonine protein kinase